MLSSLFGVRQLVSATIRRTLSSAAPVTPASTDAVNPEESVIPEAEDVSVGLAEMSNANVKQTYSADAIQKLKLDQYPLYVEREWWKKGKRMTFWATWRQLRDVNRREVLQEHGADRMRWKAIKENSVLPQAIRDEAAETLHNMPKYSRPRLILNMCQFTGRQRGKIKPYRLNRHLFRKFADHSQLSGVQRAMWMKLVLSILLIASGALGSSVQFSYLPQSVRVSPSGAVKSADLDQLNANLLGLSAQPVDGVAVNGDIFSRPKALIQVRIDGLDSSVDSKASVDLELVCSITINNTEFYFPNGWNQARLGENLAIEFGPDREFVSVSQNGVSGSAIAQVASEQKVDESRIKTKLPNLKAELEQIYRVAAAVSSQKAKFEDSNNADVYRITIEGISGLTLTAEEKEAALKDINEAIDALTIACKSAYGDQFIVEVINVSSPVDGKKYEIPEEHNIRKRDAAADYENNNIVKMRNVLNVSVFTGTDYPAIFAIFAGLIIALVLAVLYTTVGMMTMDPGKDSIIYRMTTTRMKKD